MTSRCQPVDDEPGGRGMSGEMAVQMIHAFSLHQPGGMSDLRKDPERADEEVEAAPGAHEEIPERSEVGMGRAPEKVELATQDGQREKRLKPRPGAEFDRLGMDDVGALSDQRIKVDFDT
jgi:hypothetical protein